jgi:hypothetical protein
MKGKHKKRPKEKRINVENRVLRTIMFLCDVVSRVRFLFPARCEVLRNPTQPVFSNPFSNSAMATLDKQNSPNVLVVPPASQKRAAGNDDKTGSNDGSDDERGLGQVKCRRLNFGPARKATPVETMLAPSFVQFHLEMLQLLHDKNDAVPAVVWETIQDFLASRSQRWQAKQCALGWQRMHQQALLLADNDRVEGLDHDPNGNSQSLCESPARVTVDTVDDIDTGSGLVASYLHWRCTTATAQYQTWQEPYQAVAQWTTRRIERIRAHLPMQCQRTTVEESLQNLVTSHVHSKNMTAIEAQRLRLQFLEALESTPNRTADDQMLRWQTKLQLWERLSRDLHQELDAPLEE